MMKNKMIVLLSALALSACGEDNSLADPSAAQQQSARIAYENLRDGQYDLFIEHLDPELQTYFKDNQKVMKKFAKSIPEQQYKSYTLMNKKMDTTDQGAQQYKISYEIAYPGNLVQYDVSFDQPGGSDKISNINIRVFGKSN